MATSTRPAAADDRTRVGILGAGTLGSGIAHHLAAHGAQVVLYDVSAGALELAAERMRDNAQLLVSAGYWTADQAMAGGSCVMTTHLDRAVASADYVIEAAPEDLELKRELLGTVVRLTESASIVATNSSSFLAAELLPEHAGANRLINTHFFNPAEVIDVVEICSPHGDADENAVRMRDFLITHGKDPVIVHRPVKGLVANRLQAALLREALALVRAGAVSPAELDRVVSGSFGRRVGLTGVFRTADLGGLDVFLALSTQLFPELEQDAAPPAELRHLVTAGHVGLKSRQGFYTYAEEEARSWREQLFQHLLS